MTKTLVVLLPSLASAVDIIDLTLGVGARIL